MLPIPPFEFAKAVDRDYYAPSPVSCLARMSRVQGGLGRGVTAVDVTKGPVVVPLKWEPTSYVPGSGEKLAVMVERQKRGEPLFHPFDARHPYCNLPLYWKVLEPTERELVLWGLRRSARKGSGVDSV